MAKTAKTKKVSLREKRQIAKMSFMPWTQDQLVDIIRVTSKDQWSKDTTDVAFLLSAATRVMAMDKTKICDAISNGLDAAEATWAMRDHFEQRADFLEGLSRFLRSASGRLTIAAHHIAYGAAAPKKMKKAPDAAQAENRCTGGVVLPRPFSWRDQWLTSTIQ